MFYSHQLLSRKAPLGQIWIAATMHTKINRKKIERIDIVQICEQILNPAVPLALRLSGILMGGVVIIYNRKVKYLYDDATRVMIQIKKDITKISLAGADGTVLPKGKSQAKFETITINYAMEDLDDIEQLMVGSKEHGHISMEEEFCVIQEEDPADLRKSTMFQAEPENITLPEYNLRFAERRHEEIHKFDEEERILAEDNTLHPLDLNFEEQQQVADGELLQQQHGFNTTDFQQEIQESQQKRGESAQPEADAQSVQPPVRRPCRGRGRGTNRNRKRRRNNSIIIDEDFTTIPPRVFQTWLHDPSDILKHDHHHIRNKRKKRSTVLTIDKLMWLPSTSFFSTSTKFSADPYCPMPLLELWNQNFGRQSRPHTRQPETPISRKRRAASFPYGRNDEDNFVEDQFHGEPKAEPIHINGNEKFEAPPAPELPSIEKLRARLATPNQQPEQQSYELDLLNRVPSGQSVKSKVTPASGPLPTVKEDQVLPIRRTKGKSATPNSFSIGIPGEEETVQKIGTPPLGIMSGEHINISQFDLMVETGPSQPLNQTPKDSMDDLTKRVMTHFREHFNTPGALPKQSLNQLAQGMDRRQAARLFYQTCVLVSNKYVRVAQEEAYGDIIIQRGPYL